MKDWKTTVPAAIAALAGFVLFSPEYFPGIAVAAAKYIMAGGLVVFGINAAQVKKD